MPEERAAPRLRKKGSLTIPAAVRKAARINEGDPIVVTMTEEAFS